VLERVHRLKGKREGEGAEGRFSHFVLWSPRVRKDIALVPRGPKLSTSGRP
jgi:hypothetical protein